MIDPQVESKLLNRISELKPSVEIGERQSHGSRYNNNKDILFRLNQYVKQKHSNIENFLRMASLDDVDNVIIWAINDAASADFDYDEKASHDSTPRFDIEQESKLNKNIKLSQYDIKNNLYLSQKDKDMCLQCKTASTEEHYCNDCKIEIFGSMKKLAGTFFTNPKNEDFIYDRPLKVDWHWQEESDVDDPRLIKRTKVLIDKITVADSEEVLYDHNDYDTHKKTQEDFEALSSEIDFEALSSLIADNEIEGEVSQNDSENAYGDTDSDGDFVEPLKQKSKLNYKNIILSKRKLEDVL